MTPRARVREGEKSAVQGGGLRSPTPGRVGAKNHCRRARWQRHFPALSRAGSTALKAAPKAAPKAAAATTTATAHGALWQRDTQGRAPEGGSADGYNIQAPLWCDDREGDIGHSERQR